MFPVQVHLIHFNSDSLVYPLIVLMFFGSAGFLAYEHLHGFLPGQRCLATIQQLVWASALPVGLFPLL